MRARSVPLALITIAWALSLGGCSDSDPLRSEAATFHIQSWQATTPIGSQVDFPVSVQLTIRVVRISATGSSTAPDGSSISFATTNGHFLGGSSTFQVETVEGAASATLLFDAPGSVTVTARAGNSQASVVVAVSGTGSVQLSS